MLFNGGKGARCLAAAMLAACFCSAAAAVSAQSLTVAAAADLQTVMPALAAQFQKATGRTIHVTFGSSGNFFSQIQNGAPFDLFLSADSDYPRRLEAAGLVERGSLVTYATGRIVVWARKDGPTDVTRGLSALLDARVRRISIANAEHAPYGRAAVAALRHEQMYERVRTKLVLGENVSQAAQFVDSGNADAGIIPLSLAIGPPLNERGTYYEIPTSFHPPIEQTAAVIAASLNKAAAHDFLAFLQTPDVVRLMQTYGFAPSTTGRHTPERN
jgi:molybdate transport system substrate-binding protein